MASIEEKESESSNKESDISDNIPSFAAYTAKFTDEKKKQ